MPMLLKMPLIGAVTLLASVVIAPLLAQERAPDDPYRRHGYGIGGPVFGLGRSNTAQAGACAELRFAEPTSCGRGTNFYGNGLGYGFGF